LHLVGLGFDRTDPAITTLVAEQQQARETRARRMGERLDRAADMVNCYDKAVELSGQSAPGRPWFAKVLLAEGRVRSLQHAFNRFLKPGQSAFVRTPWATMAHAIDVLHQAGGVAVLAHPTRYGFTRRKLRTVLADYVAAAGDALEVAVPGLNTNQQQLMAECLRDFPLLASGGSDFHSPEQAWLDLGRVPPMPENARAVWQGAA
jgi:predicted metal-dependent phosphoesterase TrpH